MSGRDVAEKQVVGKPDVFADIVDGTLFDGRPTVNPADLTPFATASGYRDGKAVLRGQERDVAMYWRTAGVTVAILGVENQSRPDRYMPARAMAYDGAAYREQLAKGFTGPLAPVVTIVLYYGVKPWEWATRLLDTVKAPDELRPFLNDYRMNLFDVADLGRDRGGMFRSDFRYLADCCQHLRYEPDKPWALPADGSMDHMETLDALTELTGSPAYANMGRLAQVRRMAEKGAIDMKTMLDIQLKEREEAGLSKGLSRGRLEGAVRVYRQLHYTPEQIARELDQPVETINRIIEHL